MATHSRYSNDEPTVHRARSPRSPRLPVLLSVLCVVLVASGTAPFAQPSAKSAETGATDQFKSARQPAIDPGEGGAAEPTAEQEDQRPERDTVPAEPEPAETAAIATSWPETVPPEAPPVAPSPTDSSGEVTAPTATHAGPAPTELAPPTSTPTPSSDSLLCTDPDDSSFIPGSSITVSCIYIVGREQSTMTVMANVIPAQPDGSALAELSIDDDGVWSPAGQQTQRLYAPPLLPGDAVQISVRVTASLAASGVVTVLLASEYFTTDVPPEHVRGPTAQFAATVAPPPATIPAETATPTPTVEQATATSAPTTPGRISQRTNVQPTATVERSLGPTTGPASVGIAAATVTPVVNPSGDLTCSLPDNAQRFIEPGQSRTISCTHAVGGLLVGARMTAYVPTTPPGWTVRIQGTGLTGGDSGTQTGSASLFRLLRLSSRQFTITVTAPASDTGYGSIRIVRIQVCVTDALNLACLSTPLESFAYFTLQDPDIPAAEIVCDTGLSGTSAPQAGRLVVPCHIAAIPSNAPFGLTATRIVIQWTPTSESLTVGYRSSSNEEFTSTSGQVIVETDETAGPGQTVDFSITVAPTCAPVGQQITISPSANVTPLTESGELGLPSNVPALPASPLVISITAPEIPLSVSVAGNNLIWSVQASLSEQTSPSREVTIQVTTPGCSDWQVNIALDGPLRPDAGGRTIPAEFVQVAGIGPPSPPTGATPGSTMTPLNRPVLVLSGTATGMSMTYTQTISLQVSTPAGTVTGNYHANLIMTTSAVP